MGACSLVYVVLLDVDLFLFGLTDEEAETKIQHIFALLQSNLNSADCFGTRLVHVIRTLPW